MYVMYDSNLAIVHNTCIVGELPYTLHTPIDSYRKRGTNATYARRRRLSYTHARGQAQKKRYNNTLQLSNKQQTHSNNTTDHAEQRADWNKKQATSTNINARHATRTPRTIERKRAKERETTVRKQ